MRAVVPGLLAAMSISLPAMAQEKVFGEVGLSYGQSNFEDVDESLDTFTLQGASAFVSDAGLGIQIGGSYSNLSVDEGGDLDTYTFDAHIYGDWGGFKAGAFVNTTSLGELEIYDFGSADLDTNINTYGLEAQSSWNRGTYHGYAGIGEVSDIDDVEATIYGVGADYGVTEALALTADFDGMNVSLDGSDDDASVATLAVGAEYYTAFANAPLRLSANVGRSNVSGDGFDETSTQFSLGASFLFGGNKDTSREKLFDSFRLPF